VQWCQNGDFLRLVFPASRVQHISDLHSKFALGPNRVWKHGIDIQSAAAEIRRGKKIEEEEEEERNHRAKIKWPAVLHRAAIIKRSVARSVCDSRVWLIAVVSKFPNVTLSCSVS